MTRGQLLGVSLDGAALRRPDGVAGDVRPAIGIDRLVEQAQLADRAGFDFVAIDDSFDPDELSTPLALDALIALARLAPVTTTIGLLPSVTVTHTEPFHISKNIATLDLVSAGRAGWRVKVSTTSSAADRFGRKPVALNEVLAAEAADVVEVVRRLWDSWEDDAVIRDVATGRYIDRNKLHYIDFAGEFFSVRGPSITPRSPQAHPVVAVDVDGPLGLQFAARYADLAIVCADDVARTGTRRVEVRSAAATAGRDPESVTVIATLQVSETGGGAVIERIEQLAEAGFTDGLLLEADNADTFSWLATDVLPLIGRAPRDPTEGPRTFRDRLGLERPANRYDTSGMRA